MVKVSAEVKTTYSIKVYWNDIVEVIKSKPLFGFEEFEGVDIDTITMEQLKKKMEWLGTPSLLLPTEESRKKTSAVEEMVRKLGFDGVVNYGYFDDKKQVLELSVYNWGADNI